MSKYLFVESRSTWESSEVYGVLDLIGQLGVDGHETDLFLIQNGVLMARTNSEPRLATLIVIPGVSVWADDFSLMTRSLDNADLTKGVQVANMSMFVKLLMTPGCKPIWH